jgi:Flp pilus assembly protein TadG
MRIAMACNIVRRAGISEFLRRKDGTAAIEFALLLPVLVIGVLFLSDAVTIGTGSSEMQSAVRASIQYAMNGGTDMTVAKQQGILAWADEPSNGTLTVTSACTCGASAGVCGTLCADGSDPATYVTSVATGTLGGNVLSINKTVTESVRVH